MTTLSESDKESRPWWKERMVWLIIALPASAVLAGVATVFIAARDPDDLVRSGYVKTGMAVSDVREPQMQARILQINASLVYEKETLVVEINGAGAQSQMLLLSLVHPTRDELDVQIPMTRRGDGKYQAHVVIKGSGKRHLVLEPPDKRWRIEGEWAAPFNEETRLHAGEFYSSMLS